MSAQTRRAEVSRLKTPGVPSQRPSVSASKSSESGFALLLVFLMASIIAISLYMELPRVAFQAERQKEQLLMERGMQYKRAIGLFLRTNKTRWPASIDELESFNNRRSLRKRYIDPMTGKDEWRLIHIQNGVLVDSLTNKNSNSQQQAGLQPTGFISEIQGFGQQGTGTPTINPGLRKRPSDGAPTVGPDGQPIGGSSSDGSGGSSGGFPAIPPISGVPAPPPGGFPTAGGSPLPGMPGGMPGVPPGSPVPGQPGSTGTTNSGGLSGGLMGGLTGGGLTGGGSTPQPTVPGAPPQGFGTGTAGANGQPGAVQINPAAQAAAAGLLQNLLTQPRPGGLAGITAGASGAVMGGGIAGVASKAEGQSIMVYMDKTDFSEWEFIYDPMKFQVQNPNSSNNSGPGVPASQLANNSGMSSPGTPIGTGPGGNQPTSFGSAGAQSAGFSPSSAGGASPGGFNMGGVGAAGSAGGFTNTASFPNPGAAPAGMPGGIPTTPGSGAPPAGSSAFGQAGLNPDIRPGKK